nr:uncharacterized protein LOC117605860 isoform X1 [Osmia lignaria]
MYLSEKCLISFDTSNIVVCDDIKNKIIYSCLICRVTLNTCRNLREHCQARMHLWRIKRISTETLNDSSKTLNCLSNKMGKEQTTTDNCFDITSDINEQITKLLQVSPFKSNSSEKHGHKGQRLVKRLNKVYCEEFLEIEEKMYTLDKKKLNNMELNFKPFMPYSSKNFYCLACNNTVSKELDLLYEHACLDAHKFKLNTIKEDKDSEKLIKQYMQKISEDSIKCHICKSCIKNDTDNIDAHINDKMHKKKCETFCAVIDNAFNSITQNLTNLWYSIQKFSCVPCQKSFNYKLEFIEHIATHTKDSTKEIFDFCIPCATLWLDTKNCYTEHCNDPVHKYLIKSKDFMVEDLPECIKKLLDQVDEISDVLFEQTQILMNDTIQKEVTQSLENTLKSFYPSIKAFLFGSRITGLGSVNSDIDIYLDCGNTYYQDQEESLKKKYFISIEKILHQQKEKWEVKEIIESRTPIIKLLYKPTNIQCDISLTNGLSVENSKLIRSFNDAYPPCRKLILFIKKWLSCFNLPSRHGLTNYAIAWIVIFYLQLNMHLPSVATLIKEKNKSRLICGWETGVAQPKNNNKSVQSLSMLLLGFFQFYANFDYRHYIICPLMGYALAKKDFINLDMLPKEMKPYINHIYKSNDPEYFRIDSSLCVQDPFDLSHNLTKAVSSITLKYFKQYCQDSASILSSKTK